MGLAKGRKQIQVTVSKPEGKDLKFIRFRTGEDGVPTQVEYDYEVRREDGSLHESGTGVIPAEDLGFRETDAIEILMETCLGHLHDKLGPFDPVEE